MARLKSRWNQKDRQRSIDDIAGAMGANIWRIAGDGLLNLENEGFETKTHSQRLDVICEFVVYLIHMTDRLLYGEYEEDVRRAFIVALARQLVSLIDDNRQDANGPGDYREETVAFINDRMTEYSEFAFDRDEGPGFGLRRNLGQHVRDRMGAKDNKWIPDYVIDLEAPKAMDALQRSLQGMTESAPTMRDSIVPDGGVWGEG
ncbi:MAG: hypothetical protein LJE91_03235 [Gammaproteobacteria bacterium]|jgi:hypothetical protein|nr:hypothetical protein [Gammaproteobacteria bacterium]